MKIIYRHNPLATVIELNDHEKEIFRLKIRIDELEDIAFSAHHTLTHHEWYNRAIKPRTFEETVAEAVKELDPTYYYDGEDPDTKAPIKSKLDRRVDELLAYYLADLQGEHYGDCVCNPITCGKCMAEVKLGIDTYPKGIGKHAAYHIANAFSQWNPVTKQHDLPAPTFDEALSRLKGTDVSVEQARVTIITHRATHFPGE